MVTQELPVIERETLVDRPQCREGQVIGVVLAAGGSERFGEENKLLATVNGRPMVDHAVSTFDASRLETVVVIVGNDAEAVKRAIDSTTVTTIENEHWHEGQSTSVRTGLTVANEQQADGVIFGLGDMPWLSSTTVDILVDGYYRTEASVIAAAYEGKRGNPVLFARETFDTLSEIEGDKGGRNVLLQADDAIAIETGDPGVRRDIDRPEDLSNVR